MLSLKNQQNQINKRSRVNNTATKEFLFIPTSTSTTKCRRSVSVIFHNKVTNDKIKSPSSFCEIDCMKEREISGKNEPTNNKVYLTV